MEKKLNVKIQLRRDSEANYEPSYKPLKGEFLLVDTADGKLQAKIGDGVKTFSELNYFIGDVVARGYFYNNVFYVNEQHTSQYVPYPHKIYIDNNTHAVYCYDDDSKEYFQLNRIPTATDTDAGIMKLYQSLGSNIDGAISQKITTDEINKKFEVSEDGETLIFNNFIL